MKEVVEHVTVASGVRSRVQVWLLMTVCLAGMLTLFATAVAAALAA